MNLCNLSSDLSLQNNIHKPSEDVMLIHADCRQVTNLPQVDAILTDPVWPKALPELPGSDNPYQLFNDAIQHLKQFLKPEGRIIVQLRCDSDTRLLQAIPKELPFIRAVWLPFAVPKKQGRLLISGDVAYIFGKPPKARPNNRLLPGQMPTDFCPPVKFDKNRLAIKHPCPRHLAHVEWLVEKFTLPGELILDPFLGSGTTGIAAIRRARLFAGIEISPDYFSEAVERIKAEAEYAIDD